MGENLSTPPKRGLRIGLATVALSLIGAAISLPMMAAKLAERPTLEGRKLAWFLPASKQTRFVFGSSPVAVVAVREPNEEDLAALDAAEAEKLGAGYLEIYFADDTMRLPLSPEDDPRLPGMLAHERWFKIMPLAEAAVSSREELLGLIDAGEVTPRLVAVARYPAEGYDPESWGLVRRKEWPYVFLEFYPDAPPGEQIKQSRATYGELEAIYAPGPYDDPVELSDEDRDADLWKHSAMVQVTPPQLIRAKDKTVSEALRAMGWTWPLAGVSLMGLLVGVIVVAASRVDRPE